MGDNLTPHADPVCTGQGDRDGGHCCWIAGKVCQFLDETGEIPRCSIWDRLGDQEWQNAPIGQLFARAWPGYTCIDWPQNIPEVMASPVGNCCYRGDR